jgi:5-methylthioadenosine/S-adenosylhomocysteine deaminase
MSRTLLRGARVITMAANRPDAESLDLLIENDRIVAIGEHLNDHSAEVIDYTGRIVMPGLVNTHLHTWQAGLRCIGADWTLEEYLANMHGDIARHCRPEDMRIAGLAGALSQIDSGTTTLGDWCHNNPTPAHTDAAIEGLLASGIRSVFMHGTPYTAPDAAHPIGEVDRLLLGPAKSHKLLTIGMAIRGPQLSTSKVAVADFRSAKERNIVVSMHQSGGKPGASWEAVLLAGLIDARTNIVHGAGLTEDWINTLVEAGASFTSTPENELGQGHCTPLTGQLLLLGSAPSLGTDVDSVVSGGVLMAARVALAHQRGLDHDHQRMRNRGMASSKATITRKQALSWATVEGARALGLADRIGTLEPGKQADLIVIDATRLNLWPAHDPIAAALHADTSNIEAVMIGGTWRKRDHVIIGMDAMRVREEIFESGERLISELKRGGLISAVRRKVVRGVVRQRLKMQMRT